MEEHLFERLTRERGITVEKMREIIFARIEKGWNASDPEERIQWREIPCEGEIPTPDEWLKYVWKSWRQKDRRIYCGGIRICKYNKTLKDRNKTYYKKQQSSSIGWLQYCF